MFLRTLAVLGLVLTFLVPTSLPADVCHTTDFASSADEYDTGDPIIFVETANASSAAQYSWEMEGIEVGTSSSFSFSGYSLDVDYDLKLTIADGGCVDDITKTFNLQRSPGGNIVVIWP